MTRLILATILASLSSGTAAQLPTWSRPGEFPNAGEGTKIHGTLVTSHFIHRTNELRVDKTGELRSFAMAPFAPIWFQGGEADLRDVPIGTAFEFDLTPEGRLIGMSDKLTANIRAGVPGNETTETAARKQQKRHVDFVKARGVAGWVDRAQGNVLTVTFFAGDRKAFDRDFASVFKKDAIVHVVVANDELRTWNPPVDQERAKILAVRSRSDAVEGCSGTQIDVQVNHLLEGFRRGRVVRIFGAGWPTKDQDFGESLMGYGYGRLATQEIVETPPREYPEQFPFRTDFGNDHLPWYRWKADATLPKFSDHLVLGEVVDVDPSTKSGHFRKDRSGEVVPFKLLPQAEVRVDRVVADVAKLPIGSRCRFQMYQDDSDAFTLAVAISDEASYLAKNAITYRIERIRPGDGTLHVARQIPKVMDSQGDTIQPPDIGRCELRFDSQTRIWKDGSRGTAEMLTVGEQILVNVSGEFPGRMSRCTEIWIGSESHPLLGERKKLKK